MVLNNICLHIVEFRIDYGDELQYYICGFSNYGSIKRFIDDVRYNDRDCISIRCNDVTTAIKVGEKYERTILLNFKY